MRNLKPYDGDTAAFYDSVVGARRKSKKDPEYLTRIVTYRPGIITAYTAYDGHFAANSLMTAIAVGHVNPTKRDLIRLYRYKAAVFRKLKIKLTTDDQNRLISRCQNCTINAVNSFDHLLPKEEFPEFAVHPKNLFPSCSECNGHKSTQWRNGNNPLFLNLLLDVLPDEQYLFPQVVINGSDVKLQYQVANPNGIDGAVFGVIDTHYDRLELTARFADMSGDIITNLINSILSFKDELSKEKIREATIKKAKRDLDKFGQNYWEALAVIELISSDAFYQYALDQE